MHSLWERHRWHRPATNRTLSPVCEQNTILLVCSLLIQSLQGRHWESRSLQPAGLNSSFTCHWAESSILMGAASWGFPPGECAGEANSTPPQINFDRWVGLPIYQPLDAIMMSGDRTWGWPHHLPKLAHGCVGWIRIWFPKPDAVNALMTHG